MSQTTCTIPGGRFRWTGGWRTVYPVFLLLLAVAVFAVPGLQAQHEGGGSSSASAAPDRRELWVPADKLGAVLKRHPKAVLLSREEFEALLIDAEEQLRTEKQSGPLQNLPRAVVRSVEMTATPSGKAVKLVQMFKVEVPVDGWAELPLLVDADFLASVEVDGAAALRPLMLPALPAVTKPAQPPVLVDGAPVGTLEPGDYYTKGYMDFIRGSKLEQEGELRDALIAYRRAQRTFDFVLKTFPDWNSEMCNYRKNNLQQKIAELEAKLKQQGIEVPVLKPEPEPAPAVQSSEIVAPDLDIPSLVLRGIAEEGNKSKAVTHEVVLTSIIPVRRTGSGATVSITPPLAAAVNLSFKIPDEAKLDSDVPFVVGEDGSEASFALGGRNGDPVRIRWSSEDIGELDVAAVFQKGRYLYTVDPVRIHGDLGFVLSSSLRDLPEEFEITLPAEVDVLGVEGTEVLDWDADAGKIKVSMVPGDRRAADLRVLVEMPTLADGENEADVVLPQPAVEGVHRASGTFAIFGSPEIRVRSISTPPLTLQAHGELEQEILRQPGFVAGFRFPAATGDTSVELQRLGRRFSADLDTQIEFRREAVYLNRTIAIIPKEGEIFETVVRFPDGEDVVSVVLDDGTEPDWKVADELGGAGELGGKAIVVRWAEGLGVGAKRILKVRSRRDPDGWFDLKEESIEVPFVSAELIGAEKVSGYLAVDFPDSYRVQTKDESGLERRFAGSGDGAPVKGKLAWFRLREYGLTLDISRRSAEIEADLIAYALPLAGSLEIEGQLALEIGLAPMREVEIGLPAGIAENFRLDSVLVSEKQLDAETGIWTFQFHQELQGRQDLRFRMSIPFEDVEGDHDDGKVAKPFETSIPAISLPGAKRIKGWWLIEANTDTELTFSAEGLDEGDALRVPNLPGYVPRHRVIAAYQFRGSEYSLSVEGQRHRPKALVSTVIESLEIDSVFASDGLSRHQAICRIRAAGEQFFEVSLPAEGEKTADLLSVSVDGEGVKPILGKDKNAVRVALPDSAVNGSAVDVKLIYQMASGDWGSKGARTAKPLGIDKGIPILDCQWRIHLPDGYSYREFESNLRRRFDSGDKSLVAVIGNRFKSSSDGLHSYAYDEQAVREPGAGIAPEIQFRSDVSSSFHRGELSGEFDQALIEAQERKLDSLIIPKIEFRETRLPDALRFIEAQSRYHDPDPEESRRGLKFEFDFGREEQDATVTLESQNLPLRTAIEYVCRLSGMIYVVRPQGIVITYKTAGSPDFFTRTFDVPADFLDMGSFSTNPGPVDSFAPEVGEGALVQKPMAKDILERQNILFPPGSSVFYNKATGKVTVTQTAQNMALIESFLEPLEAPSPPPDSRTAGLISLDFQIPEDGTMYAFDGLYAPTEVNFNYVAWESEVRVGWLWIALGAFLYFLLGFERPLFMGIFGALLLAFLPTILWQSATVVFNAILIGWLGAMAVQLACRLFQYFESRPNRATTAVSDAW